MDLVVYTDLIRIWIISSQIIFFFLFKLVREFEIDINDNDNLLTKTLIRSGYVDSKLIHIENKTLTEISQNPTTGDFSRCFVHHNVFKMVCHMNTNTQIILSKYEKNLVTVLRIKMKVWECTEKDCVYLMYCKIHDIW